MSGGDPERSVLWDRPWSTPAEGRAFLCWVTVAAVVLPALLSVMVYRGFTTNYRIGVYTESDFSMRYDEGVYRYRILGPRIVRAVDAVIAETRLGRQLTRFLVPDFVRSEVNVRDTTLYAALFLTNTLFLCLGSVALYLLLHGIRGPTHGLLRDVLFLCVLLLVLLSQFVIVPYDTLFYSIFSAAMLTVFAADRSGGVWVLIALVLLGTLTRESVVLILSFYAALHWRRGDLFDRARLGALGSLAAVVVVTYVLLRVWLGPERGAFQQFRFVENVTSLSSIVGLLVAVALGAVLLRGMRDRVLGRAFLLASSPYLGAVVLVADPWELRLWIPIAIALVTLSLIESPHGDNLHAEGSA